MNSDQKSAENPTRSERAWGAAESASPCWGVRQTLAAVGVAAVVAGLGGAAIYAATDGDSASMGGGTPPGFGPGGPGGMPGGPGAMPVMPGPGGPPPGGMHGPGRDAAGAAQLHGEFVVSDGSGGYATMLTQTGTVTAISATSITVRSDDGYTQTYATPPTAGGADASLAVNDQVTVRAIRTGQTATVTSIGNPELVGPGGPPHRN